MTEPITLARKCHPLYMIWGGIKSRCFNKKAPNYARYGGRGITMCSSWAASFDAFVANMGERPSMAHSVDRIDVNGNYEPGNCRWATRSEQQRNRRDSCLLTHDGETLSIWDWSERTGVPASKIWKRLRSGAPVDVCLSTSDQFARGVRSPSATVHDSAVRDIRSRRAQGERLASIAKDYGITESQVSKIFKGKAWKHVA